MKRVLVLLVVFISVNNFAQKSPTVLFQIDKESFSVAEFKRVYEKNLSLLSDKEEKDVENYLDLFVNFKLKVKEAYRLQLDTIRRYKREIGSYKNQLISPYLQDTIFFNKLIKDAYHRTKYKINVSHIMVKLPNNYTPKDTLKAYHKIVEARKAILSGEPFKDVAIKYSEDPSVKNNSGNLGYFTAFRMVHTFENIAYSTKVGSLSNPFKTRFGYHILKVNDKQLSEGEVEVAHILITDKTSVGKKKIDSIYTGLIKGADFDKLVLKYSNDKGSISNGGKLPKFGVGSMFKDFEEKAFALHKINQYSKPFLTKYGWHILKLLNKIPVQSFEMIKDELVSKVRASGGVKMSVLQILNKLKKKYKLKTYPKALKTFEEENIRGTKKSKLNQTILSINDKNILQSSFFDYIRNRRHKSISALFLEFTNKEVLNYFKENLMYTEPKFANTLKEYQEGLLVFDLMQKNVWNKAAKDSLGLQSYFTNNIKNYAFKNILDNKGKVISDYQDFLEAQVTLSLRKKYKVSIKKRSLKKIIKYYQNHE